MVADRLAERHFTAQGETGTGLDAVDVLSLDPLLRGLLFTDGTVTRALEAQTLAPVSVQAVEQEPAHPPPLQARYLQVDGTEECIRRRVVMHVAETSLSVWAESYVVPQRLPADFLASLEGSPHGIGGSLARLKLESWRELLWFGLAPPPTWSRHPTTATSALTRLYLIVTQRMPTLLISEAFAVERRNGVYHLSGATPT